jgi:multimeric flavodoxin WrbA
MTKVLCVEASARADGLTATVAKACLAGAEEAGAETEFVQLKGLKLERCRMCDPEGWGLCLSEGRCVIEDDLAGLVEKIRSADGLVMATPVYYSDLSESLKTFLDRFRRISGGKERKLKDKPTVIIAAAGGSGNGTTHCLFQLERTMQILGAFVLDSIPAAQRNRDYKSEVARLAGRALGRKAAGK